MKILGLFICCLLFFLIVALQAVVPGTYPDFLLILASSQIFLSFVIAVLGLIICSEEFK